ncbi:MAG: hypothetical protein DRP28_06880 [Thermodesulfobacteriota bacterium]|nr:MAG: hypothetical protein DRP28_06880 [Thermodesulfobacteriota bacterium]
MGLPKLKNSKKFKRTYKVYSEMASRSSQGFLSRQVLIRDWRDNTSKEPNLIEEFYVSLLTHILF